MHLNAIKEMERFARNDDAVISLGQGIPSRKTDRRLHEAACSAIESGHVDRYSDPQGLIELRDQICLLLNDQSMNYSRDEVVITAGAIEGLNSVLRCMITEQKSEVIMPTPVYGAYFNLIELAHGKVVPVPLIETENWRLDVDAVIAKMNSATAAILLCNPNNPTGTIYDKTTLTKIAAAAMKQGITIICDEVYSNMLYSAKKHYSLATESRYKNHVVRIMSFSKDFSLTGWRVGYVQAPRHMISQIIAVHDSLVNCAPVVSQYVAMEALRHYNQIIASNRREYLLHRDVMVTELQRSQKVTLSLPEAGYCLFPKIDGVKDSVTLAYQLAQKGVVVVPGSAFGKNGEGHLRLCYGRPLEDVREGTRRLVKLLEGEVL